MDDFDISVDEFDEYLDETQDLIEVEGCSGATYKVLSDEEKIWWEAVRDRYLADNKFSNISDLQDMDRVLQMELIMYRYGRWVTDGNDYDGQAVDETQLNKDIRDYNKEVRALKDSIGIDKKSRDKDRGDSIAAYIENLRQRAKEFGVMRNEQATMAITLMKKIQSLIELYDNCDDYEKEQNKYSAEELFGWIRNVAIPQFDEIDKNFRETNQKYWIREM